MVIPVPSHPATARAFRRPRRFVVPTGPGMPQAAMTLDQAVFIGRIIELAGLEVTSQLVARIYVELPELDAESILMYVRGLPC